MSKILNFIYPRKCIFCEKILDYKALEKQDFTCNNCKIKLEYISRDRILKKETKMHYDFSYSSYAYKDFIRDLILRFKFSNKKYLYEFLSYKAISDLQKLGVKFDFILYVPISYKRYLERGYNQSKLIAKEISRKMQIPFLSFRLIKIKHNTAQSLINKTERNNNVRGVYRVIFGNVLKGKTILLVDDILTTGHTLDECSKVLKKAGVVKIIAVTIAKA